MAYLGALLGILELSMLLIVGKLGEESFSKMGMIPFVGAIVLGIIVGPGLLGLMTSSPYIEEFTSLGIVFILFMAGIEDKPRAFWASRNPLVQASLLSARLLRFLPWPSCWFLA
jgi:Kef-type K+ transport system membrane component KefB